MENGQQVTIISMEKNRNMIEDKFIAGKLVERKVNGKVEELPQQVANHWFIYSRYLGSLISGGIK